MAWFKKTKKPKLVRTDRPESRVPEGLWVKCEGCKEIVYSRDLDQNLKVCPKCGYHFRIDANARIRLLLDETEPDELFYAVGPKDPLGFKDTKRYRDRLKTYQQALGELDAVVVVAGPPRRDPGGAGGDGVPLHGRLDGLGGGREDHPRRRARARAELPLVVVSASGGARMQEGVLSLMQMAKIAAALHRLREARLPYLSVLTDPTTGGVTASFAMLGDLNIAEPGALIGFAGPRVIEQTIRQSLPPGFQRSEFLLEHGFLDLVVERPEMKGTLARCLRHFT